MPKNGPRRLPTSWKSSRRWRSTSCVRRWTVWRHWSGDMAEYKDREHYIPLRKSDLVDMLCTDLGADRASAQQFRQLGDLISATFHYEYYKLLEELKDEYAPFDPDSVTASVIQLTPEQKE